MIGRRRMLGTTTSRDRAGDPARFDVLTFVPPTTPELEWVEVYKRTVANTASGDVLVDRARVVDWSSGVYPYFHILQHSVEGAEYVVDYLDYNLAPLTDRISTEQYVMPAAVQREIMVNGPQYVRELVRRDYVVLETMGERAILMRKRHSGVRCECVISEHRAARSSCRQCYGTGWDGGYDVFAPFLFNFQMAGDRLQLTDQAISIDQAPRAWTTIGPELRDGDIVVRLHQQLMDRFEVTNPQRSWRDGVAAVPTIQEFTVKAMLITHPSYGFPVEQYVPTYTKPTSHSGQPPAGE